jgi:hypothetical protein
MAYRNAENYPEPWDVRCRWNFMAIGRDCSLLRTYWKSVNYQWKDVKIVFFAENSEAEAIQEVTCPDRFISSQAVVVHGCKDGSLHKMAIAGFPMPSDSTGLDIPSNSMGLESIPDQEQSFSNVSVGDEIEIIHIPVREPDTTLQPHTSCHGLSINVEPVVQNVDTCLQGTTVCNKTSDKKRPTVKKRQKTAKKRRNLSPEERQRRSDAMKKILARKAERKAQGVV